MAWTHSATLPQAPIALLAAAFAGALAAGCAPPGVAVGPSAEVLYAGDGAEGTVTPLDSQTGRPVASPVPVGGTPAQIVAGPLGSLLVLASTAQPGGRNALTHVVRSGSSWRTRPVAIEMPAYDATMAGDGERYAVVAYRLVPPAGGGPLQSQPGCRLALVDIAAGVVGRTLSVCGPREGVTSVALVSGPDRLVAYLGIWQAVEDGGDSGLVRGRVVALDVMSGATIAVAPLVGQPGLLVHMPDTSPFDARLYCVERESFVAYDTSAGSRSRLLVLDPVSLQIEREVPLRASPLQFAVAPAPDGEHVYALTSGGGSLVRLDPATGAEVPVVSFPGQGFGLAVAAASIYVSDPKGHAIWMVDRRRGTVAKSVRAGPQPTVLALGSWRG